MLKKALMDVVNEFIYSIINLYKRIALPLQKHSILRNHFNQSFPHLEIFLVFNFKTHYQMRNVLNLFKSHKFSRNLNRMTSCFPYKK